MPIEEFKKGYGVKDYLYILKDAIPLIHKQKIDFKELVTTVPREFALERKSLKPYIYAIEAWENTGSLDITKLINDCKIKLDQNVPFRDEVFEGMLCGYEAFCTG